MRRCWRSRQPTAANANPNAAALASRTSSGNHPCSVAYLTRKPTPKKSTTRPTCTMRCMLTNHSTSGWERRGAAGATGGGVAAGSACATVARSRGGASVTGSSSMVVSGTGATACARAASSGQDGNGAALVEGGATDKAVVGCGTGSGVNARPSSSNCRRPSSAANRWRTARHPKKAAKARAIFKKQESNKKQSFIVELLPHSSRSVGWVMQQYNKCVSRLSSAFLLMHGSLPVAFCACTIKKV